MENEKIDKKKMIFNFMPGIVAIVFTMFLLNKTFFEINKFLNIGLGLNQPNQLLVIIVWNNVAKFILEFSFYWVIFKSVYETLKTICFRICLLHQKKRKNTKIYQQDICSRLKLRKNTNEDRFRLTNFTLNEVLKYTKYGCIENDIENKRALEVMVWAINKYHDFDKLQEEYCKEKEQELKKYGKIK